MTLYRKDCAGSFLYRLHNSNLLGKDNAGKSLEDSSSLQDIKDIERLSKFRLDKHIIYHAKLKSDSNIAKR